MNQSITCTIDPDCPQPARVHVITRKGVFGPACYTHGYVATSRFRDLAWVTLRLDPELDAAPRPDRLEAAVLDALFASRDGAAVVGVEWAVTASLLFDSGSVTNTMLYIGPDNVTAAALVRSVAEGITRRDGGDAR